MLYFLSKTFISALIIAGTSELARRYTVWAALLASLPLTSILAFIWLYKDTKDNVKISELSYSIFWLVLPSLSFFLVLPFLLKQQWAFPTALLTSIMVMLLLYGIGIWLYKTF